MRRLFYPSLTCFLSFIFCLLFSRSFGQGLINNGASINMNGGATVYISGGSAGNYTNENSGQITATTADSIKLEGNWTNNASNNVFTSNGGTVTLLGDTQTIGGTNSTSFNTLKLQGTGTKALGSNILVGGGYSSPAGLLNLNDRPLNLNGNTLTISNPISGTSSTGAIQYTSGYIISEQDSSVNNSIIAWEMGGASNTGDHIFPFGTAGGTQIPVTFTITSTGNTTISASTRRTIDNDCAPNIAGSCNKPWTSGVTNMNGFADTDISVSSVIDRWWEIDPSSPAVANLILTYQGIENTTNNPTGNFTAEEWQGNKWIYSFGGGYGVTSGTGSEYIYSISTFGTIVLAEESDELPIGLLSFESSCLSKGTALSWSTVTEENSNYFTIERTFNSDGTDFTAIATIKAGGNTNTTHNYSYIDSSAYSTTAYYRLSETDMNGHTTYFQIISADCHNTDVSPFAMAIYPNPNTGNLLNVHLTGLAGNAALQIRLIDMLGRQVMPTSYVQADENGSLATQLDLNSTLPKAMYNVVIEASGNTLMTKSFVIQ